MKELKRIVADMETVFAQSSYPKDFLAAYDQMECLASHTGRETFLVRRKTDGETAVATCYDRAVFPLRPDIQLLRDLNHCGLPHYYEQYQNEQMLCIVREYIEGEPLNAYARDRQLSIGDIASMAKRLCDILEALHTHVPPVVHRDIKPENIIVKPDGSIVLIDFDIARAVKEGGGTDTVFFGTKGYAPPEQYGFGQTDSRADIYAFGVLLRWLVTGSERANGNISIDPDLQKIIERCTAFAPEQRFSNIGEVRRALEAVGGRKRRFDPRIAVALALAAILMLCAGFVAGRWTDWLKPEEKAVFQEPLIERAVQMSLGLKEGQPVARNRLAEVKSIYIVAGEAYPDAYHFYPAINQWYADGKPERGVTVSLEDLSQLPNVEQVCVVAEKLGDITPVTGLARLNKVEFKHNAIEDISPLAGILTLTSVGLNGNPVRDISPLAECPKLAFLDLCDVRSYDPSVIAQLGNFDFLDLSNPTESYNYLSGKSVLSLRLSWTGLTSLDALDGVTRLEDLQIAHTSVSDLSHLTLHPGLKTLNIAAIPARDLTPLLELPQLNTLVVSEDMLSQVERLGEVPFEVRVE